LLNRIDAKETLFLFSEVPFSTDPKKNIISPVALHNVKIIEFTIKLDITNEIPKRGAIKFVINSIIPLVRPRFSIRVQSAKRAKHEGIPNPNETPKRMLATKTCVTVKLPSRASDGDVTTPKITQK
jgi:hypothetical protein